MPTESPLPPPAPRQLVQMLRIHAWADHIDDDSREFLWWSADTIEQLLARCVRLSQSLERAEASP